MINRLFSIQIEEISFIMVKAYKLMDMFLSIFKDIIDIFPIFTISEIQLEWISSENQKEITIVWSKRLSEKQ